MIIKKEAISTTGSFLPPSICAWKQKQSKSPQRRTAPMTNKRFFFSPPSSLLFLKIHVMLWNNECLSPELPSQRVHGAGLRICKSKRCRGEEGGEKNPKSRDAELWRLGADLSVWSCVRGVFSSYQWRERRGEEGRKGEGLAFRVNFKNRRWLCPQKITGAFFSVCEKVFRSLIIH